MKNNELDDLSRYFRLYRYRDEGDILEDEYGELEEIIKRNETVKKIEDARVKWIFKKISEEEFTTIFDEAFNNFMAAKDYKLIKKRK